MKKYIAAVLALLISAAAFADSVIMLRENGPLRVEDAEGGANWSITVPAGTVLQLVKNDVVLKTLKTSKGDIPNYKFYKVKYEKKEYLASANEVAKGFYAGVIVRDITLFEKPALSSFVNARLEKGTIVVAGNPVRKNGVSFTPVTYYSDVVKNRYVLTDSLSVDAPDYSQPAVSVRKDDVTAVMVLNKVSSEEDEEIKKVLLESIRNLELDRNIWEMVDAEYSKYAGTESITSEFLPDSEPVEGEIFCEINTGDSDNARIRITPVNGEVIASVPNGTVFRIERKTVEVFDVGDKSSCWYYVSNDNVSGWVFGGLITLTAQ